MNEGPLCEEILVSVASPPTTPSRYLEDGYAQNFKLFCTPSCTPVNLYFRFFVIMLLFMYARNISTTVRSHFMLLPFYVLNKHKWTFYQQNVTRR